MTGSAKSKENIKKFVERWKGRGYEKGDSQVKSHNLTISVKKLVV